MTVLKYICHANCMGTASWSVQPFFEDIYVKFMYKGNKNDFLYLPPGTFAHGVTYHVYAVLGRTSSGVTLSFTLPQINLTVGCVANCHRRHREIVFQVNCTGTCVGLDYIWEIFPRPYSWLWSEKMLSGDTSGRYTFPPYTFLPETGAMVNVMTFGNKANTSFIVDKYSPKLKITCLSNKVKCVRPNAAHDVYVRVKCLSDCDFPQYFWLPSPPFKIGESKIIRNFTTKDFSIPANSYHPGETVKLSLFVDELNKAAELIIKYADPPELQIICIKNCNQTEANPYRPSILQVNCKGVCDNMTYTWSISPLPLFKEQENLDMIANGTQLFIASNSYMPEQTINVSVEVSGFKVYYSYPYTTPKTNLTIYCIQNCLDPTNPSEEKVLLGVCLRFCDEIEFVWEVEPMEAPFFWHDKIELSFRNRSITLKKRLLLENRHLKITLLGVPGNSSAILEFNIEKPTPQLVLECLENCEHFWIHKNVKYRVLCVDNCIDMNYTWKLYDGFNEVKDPPLNNESESYIIPAFSFKDGRRIEIEVSVRNGTASAIMTFNEKAPILRLSCYPKKCNSAQNRLERVSVAVECLRQCQEDQTYLWTLHPQQSAELWANNILRSVYNKTITFLPKTFDSNFNLTVFVHTEGAEVNTLILFVDPKPEINVVCVKNCNHSNPYEPVHLRASCEWLCHYIDTYIWSIALPPNTTKEELFDKLKVTPKKSQVIIPSNIYRDGDVVDVRVQGGSTIATYAISFVEPAPELEIVCKRHCEYSPAKDVVLEAFCKSNCKIPHLFKWKNNRHSNRVRYYNRNKALVIPRRTYRNREDVVFNVCQGKGCATKRVTFIIPYSHFKITCLENCNNFTGNPKLKSVIHIVCLTFCEEQESAYNWTVDPLPVSAKHPFHIDESSERLTIKPNLYPNGTCVNILVVRGDYSATTDFCFIQPKPVVYILCDKNCGYPDPRYDFVVNVTCFEHCYGLNYDWYISPQPRQFRWEDNIHLSPGNMTLTVKAYTYDDNEKVLLTAVVSGFGVAMATTFSLPPPILKLLCLLCERAAPDKDVVITVICLDQCDNIRYLWDINPLPDGFVWSLNISISAFNTTFVIAKNTYSEKSIAYVTVHSNKSTSAAIAVNYIRDTPTLTLNCHTNCIFSPFESVFFVLNCEGDCIRESNLFKCLTRYNNEKPVSSKIIYMNNTAALVEILPKEGRERIELNCSLEAHEAEAHKAEAHSTFYFGAHFWKGSCAIHPQIGISGETEHTLECIDFVSNATYIVVQVAIGATDRYDMILLHSQQKFIPNLYLTVHIERIVIFIGWGWDIKVIREIRTIKSIPPFSRHFSKEIGIELDKRCIEVGILLKNQQYQKAIQLAAATQSAMKYYNSTINSHYRKILYALMLPYTHEMEPYQLLSFVYAMLQLNISLHTNRMGLEVARRAAERVIFMVPHYNLTTQFYEPARRIIISIIAASWLISGDAIAKEIMSKAPIKSQNDKNQRTLNIGIDDLAQIFQDPKHSTYHNYLYDNLDHWFTMKIIIRKLFTLIEMIGFFIVPDNKIVEGGNQYFYILSARVRVQMREKIIFNISNSLVFLLRDMFLDAAIVTVSVALFNHTQFWNAPQFGTAHGEIIFVSLTDQKAVQIQGAYRAYIKLFNDKKMETVFLNPAGNFCAVQIQVPLNHTLQLTAFVQHGYLSFSYFKPSRWHRSKKEIYVDGSKTLLYTAGISPIYIGILSTSTSILNFTLLSCLTWHGIEDSWKLEGCTVSTELIEAKFVICECTKSVLLSANTKKAVYSFFTEEKSFESPILDKFEIELIIIIGISTVLLIVLICLEALGQIHQQADCIFLKDNDHEATDVFILYVRTGMIPGSGTTARIAVQLIGSWCNSSVHVLNLTYVNALQRNSMISFVLMSSKRIGQLKMLRIWSDYTGQSPDWFCDSIVVRHFDGQRRYVFVISRWFSLYKFPCTLRGIFKPKRRFKIPYQVKIESALRSTHTYFSVFTTNRMRITKPESVVITLVAILLVFTINLVILSLDSNSFIKYVVAIAVSIITAELVSCFLDILFRYS